MKLCITVIIIPINKNVSIHMLATNNYSLTIQNDLNIIVIIILLSSRRFPHPLLPISSFFNLLSAPFIAGIAALTPVLLQNIPFIPLFNPWKRAIAIATNIVTFTRFVLVGLYSLTETSCIWSC